MTINSSKLEKTRSKLCIIDNNLNEKLKMLIIINFLSFLLISKFQHKDIFENF